MPESVSEQCRIVNAKISSLEFISPNIKVLHLFGCKNLKSLPKTDKLLPNLESIGFAHINLTSNILSLLKIKTLEIIAVNDYSLSPPMFKALSILKKYASAKDHDILGCQDELIENGFSQLAKL
jgi:hypothetical protein